MSISLQNTRHFSWDGLEPVLQRSGTVLRRLGVDLCPFIGAGAAFAVKSKSEPVDSAQSRGPIQTQTFRKEYGHLCGSKRTKELEGSFSRRFTTSRVVACQFFPASDPRPAKVTSRARVLGHGCLISRRPDSSKQLAGRTICLDPGITWTGSSEDLSHWQASSN
ncbi:hypothetical protein PSHT_05198 [Puccinia striiformis]|uniref:Uncharacterized protein n=1 Tax=Puccinia striiformis TaxID=27350 RepID=A0A2S4WB01_9BASI|nr:hypothetical protein PSHT_05198 [Puccinia striiformis]